MDKSMGDIDVAIGNLIHPATKKNLCSLSSTVVMLHIKFDEDRSTCLRDNQV